MRGKKLTSDELEAIKLLRSKGYTIRKIAELLKRGKSGIAGAVKRMEADGSSSQQVKDLGRSNGKE